MTETNKKWAFIVNPIAGNGASKEIIPKLNEEIAKRKIDAKIVYTEVSGHATKLAEEFIKNRFIHIIAVGGDGTFNEVSKAIIPNSENIITGVIPCGTGNDFIQILGFPERFEQEHWDTFFKQNLKFLDVGVCNGKTFTNGMGLGFDAKVAEQNYVAPDEVKTGGKGKYLWHIIKTILFYKEKEMKIISQDDKKAYCFINTVSIGRRFAGGFYLTPKAIADDGLLDICFVDKLSIPRRLKILGKVPKGKHIEDKKVTYYQTDKLVVEFKENVPYHLDGELFFDQKLDINIITRALRIIYNPNGNHFFMKKN